MQRGSIRLFTLVSVLALGACAQGNDVQSGITDTILDSAKPGAVGSVHDEGPGSDADTDGDTNVGEEPAPGGGSEPAPVPGDAPGNDGDSATGADGDPGGEGEQPTGGSPDTWEGMRVGTNFWFLSAGWAEEAWNGNVDFANSQNPWNPAFVADLEESHYAVFRFMDFGGTNNSSIRNWSERTQQTSPQNQDGGGVGGRGIAYEWMFDLCNRMQTDCWITAPHLAVESYEQNANDNYFTELAKLAKEQLDPGLNLYVEYSNETWNPGFGQAGYCQQRGMQMGFAPDAYSASFKFHVYASSRMYDAFVKVYGDEIDRVKWVVSGQLGSTWGTEKQVEALKDTQINLGGRTPDFYSISNYVASDVPLDGAASDIVSQYRAAIDKMAQQARDQKALVSGMGMRFISYEGGQHLTTNADALSRNPAIYDLYTQWLETSAGIYDMTVHYGNSGSFSGGGAWGAREYTGQPLSEAHKARALADYIDAHQE